MQRFSKLAVQESIKKLAIELISGFIRSIKGREKELEIMKKKILGLPLSRFMNLTMILGFSDVYEIQF